MRRFGLSLAIIAAVAVGADAASDQHVAPVYLYRSAGPGQMNLSVASLTNLSPPQGATIAEICAGAVAVNYRDDQLTGGASPTSSSGIQMQPLQCMQYAGSLAVIQFISTSGAAAISVLYYATAN